MNGCPRGNVYVDVYFRGALERPNKFDLMSDLAALVAMFTLMFIFEGQSKYLINLTERVIWQT